MTSNTRNYHPAHYLTAWAVHALTASAAFFGIYTLMKIYQHQYVYALWLMGITVAIDAIDGTLARLVKVKSVLPNIDGTLLDNIVDYLNYVITPCFFLYVKGDILPPNFLIFFIISITITSSYQFCQTDAKTPDHFFKGFPCFWNIAVFYMFIFQTSMYTNACILITLCFLVFVPIKYVYPSRLDYLTELKSLKVMLHTFSLIYGLSSIFILASYPNIPSIWLALSLSYVVMYLILSIYRTYVPMPSQDLT